MAMVFGCTVNGARCTVARSETRNWKIMNGYSENTKTVKGFEDLEVWKNAMQLVVAIYAEFKENKDYGFKDQIQRAAVSVPSNIAEGYERQTNKEFIQFLYIAKGSSGELQTQLYIAQKLNYITKDKAKELIDKSKKISSMIYNLINYRKSIK